MKLSQKSQWDKPQIETFLEKTEFPVRLSFLNNAKEPRICSLWYLYQDEAIWCASHKNSYLVSQLKKRQQVSFEISTNEYPYKGVRGSAEVELSTMKADDVLQSLISRYLGNSNTELSSWLLSRVEDEYVIKINPLQVNSWDFSHRMNAPKNS